MKKETRNIIALRLASKKIKWTFGEEPNTSKSMKVSMNMAKKTGIAYLEIHRFHNAIINNNVQNSFKDERAAQISLLLVKEIIKAEVGMPNLKMRGQLSELANEFGVSFNDMLEFVREIYLEIVNETLKPQSQA